MQKLPTVLDRVGEEKFGSTALVEQSFTQPTSRVVEFSVCDNLVNHLSHWYGLVAPRNSR